jgi:hypothetical protein
MKNSLKIKFKGNLKIYENHLLFRIKRKEKISRAVIRD